jgi:hypothetical protein
LKNQIEVLTTKNDSLIDDISEKKKENSTLEDTISDQNRKIGELDEKDLKNGKKINKEIESNKLALNTIRELKEVNMKLNGDILIKDVTIADLKAKLIKNPTASNDKLLKIIGKLVIITIENLKEKRDIQLYKINDSRSLNLKIIEFIHDDYNIEIELDLFQEILDAKWFPSKMRTFLNEYIIHR